MPFPSATFLHNIQGVVPWVADECEALYSQLIGFLSKEHNDDGTHSAITATSLTLNGYAAGTVTHVTYDPLNFRASAGLWTVGAADQVTLSYTVIGHCMVLIFDIVNTDVTAGGVLQLTIPGGYVCTRRVTGTCLATDAGVTAVGITQVAAGGTVINCYATVAAGNFAITAGNNTNVQGFLVLEV